MSNVIKTVKVGASSGYDVVIGRGLLNNAGEIIKNVVKPCKIALITDDNVDGLYSETIINSLAKAGYEVVKFVFPHGEESKNLDTYAKILNFLAESKLTRTDALVALGGGVVGDITGFAAATYLRGVKYIQIPTTLLAQVDSSVGGKTAVDLPSGKNLVGAFCQPKVVICDATALESLPKTIFTDGMGEIAKYAILDEKVFNLIDKGYEDIVDLIYLCVDYKRKIVEADEFESGERKLLNLGHTPAHGIEKLSNYLISHGNAVAMGLKIIINASKKQGLIDENTHLDALSVVEKCAGKTENPFAIKDLCDTMLFDKKRSGNTISLTMIYGIGDCRSVNVKIDELWGYLS